jgi:hypothetical protein
MVHVRMRQYYEIQAGRVERERIMVARLICIASLEHAAVHKETAVIGFYVETRTRHRFCCAKERYPHLYSTSQNIL